MLKSLYPKYLKSLLGPPEPSVPFLYPYVLLPDPPWKRIQHRGSELFRPKRAPRATQVMPGPPIVLPRAPKCTFGSISASFRSPQTFKNHEHLMESIANPAYRVFAALVAQGSSRTSKNIKKRSPGTPQTPPELPKGPQGAPRSSPRDSKNPPQSTPRGHMVAPTASDGAVGAFWT